ncbi:MAG: autotransporter-associated beta strand repeat-containing protein, partial [Planctomycetota bacterium]
TTLVLDGGVSIGPEALTLGDDLGTGTLISRGSTNTFGGDVTLGGTTATVDSKAGTTTVLGGAVDMGLSSLTVTGDGDTVIEGPISGTSAGDPIIDPGLLGGHQPGHMDFGPNSGNLGLVLSPQGAAATGKDAHWKAVIGQNNSTLVYTGQIYLDDDPAPGGSNPTTFVESIDDRTYLVIDGETVLNNSNWQDTTHGTLSRPAGWYDIELRFSNGTGDYGPVKKDGWTADYGFGMDVDGNDNEDEANFVFPADPGDASLFRVVTPTSPSDLIKTGGGTLTLAGDNTYIGITDVQAGTLVVNGTTSGQGDYIVHPGATLAGSGTIGLADGKKIDILDGGTVAPGNSTDPLSVVGQFVMDGTYDWELTPSGTDLILGAGANDTLTLEDWTLRVLDGDVDSWASSMWPLFQGFENIEGINDFSLDPSGLPPWRQFTHLSEPRIVIQGDTAYLTGLTTVPEPASLALLALGALALARRRQRL